MSKVIFKSLVEMISNIVLKICRSIIFSTLMLVLSYGHVFAADFTAVDINGDWRKLTDYRGKWVVVNFWASWCAPCREEMPDLTRFHSKHKDSDAIVLGINHEDDLDKKELRRVVTALKIQYPVLLSNPDILKNLGPVTVLPTTYLIRPNGEIAAWIEGPITAEKIEKFINDSFDQGNVSLVISNLPAR
jgi:thiol-disulfide isomerase/thioredoxin